MPKFLNKWLTVSLLNLLIVACLGVLLRYKIAFSLPFIEQKHVLHSHSNFAFSGWITQTLMVLLVHYLGLHKGEIVIKRYRWLLYANLVAAYGMLVCFMIQGYGFFSISFSNLSILTSYFFAWYFWKDLNNIGKNKISHYWFKAALLFNVLSSVGAFGLAFMMANKIVHQNWYLATVYFYLHFQYNGWFFFAGMGLLVSRLELMTSLTKKLRMIFRLFCLACLPAYLLSALWLRYPDIIYWIIILAVIAQIAGWYLMTKILIENKIFIQKIFTANGRILLLFSAIAFTIKIILQSGSTHPALSQLSFGFRPIVIGYLHLVLLAVTTIFIFGYIIGLELLPISKAMLIGCFIFVAGIIINEILLMLQGVTALNYNSIPYMNEFLLSAAVILLVGAGLLFLSSFNKIKTEQIP